eukprot:1717320-Amphidinium_carterae.1
MVQAYPKMHARRDCSAHEAREGESSWSISDASLIKNAFGCGKFCECSGMCLLRHSAVLFALFVCDPSTSDTPCT